LQQDIPNGRFKNKLNSLTKIEMKTMIQTQSLCKHYKEVSAVNNLDLEIKEGEIYGFLGLNGAGKTTSIRMLLGLIKASSGKAWLDGKAVSSSNSSIWEQVGYLVEVPHAYPNLTVRENLELICKLRDIKDPLIIKQILQKLDIEQYANRKTAKLSLGNKQRLGLAKSLIHNPKILILDEPTNGLDPSGIHEIRELLKDLAYNQGVTILVSSHILGEIAQFTSRIGIIHKGILINEFATSQLDILCNKHLKIITNDNNAALEFLSERGYENVEIDKNEIKIDDASAFDDPTSISELLNGNFKLKKLNIEEENLESYFLRTINTYKS
jgi:ABC-2 type transport system ATP-binding protein